MSTARTITLRLIEEGINARAHFQVWWALRNLALPKYLPAMNDRAYVDFFHAANSGHYLQFLLALSKIFDRDSRVAGIRELKRALRTEGLGGVANEISMELKPHVGHVKSIMRIRNSSVVHNEYGVSRKKVYEINGITPNQIRGVIDAACQSINLAASALSIVNTIFEGDRAERATLNLLEALHRSRHCE